MPLLTREGLDPNFAKQVDRSGLEEAIKSPIKQEQEDSLPENYWSGLDAFGRGIQDTYLSPHWLYGRHFAEGETQAFVAKNRRKVGYSAEPKEDGTKFHLNTPEGERVSFYTDAEASEYAKTTYPGRPITDSQRDEATKGEFLFQQAKTEEAVKSAGIFPYVAGGFLGGFTDVPVMFLTAGTLAGVAGVSRGLLAVQTATAATQAIAGAGRVARAGAAAKRAVGAVAGAGGAVTKVASGAIHAKTTGGAVFKGAAFGAVEEVAIQAIAEPTIESNFELLGYEYTDEDRAINYMFAALFGAGIGGFIGGVGNKLGRMARGMKHDRKLNAEQRAKADELAESAEQITKAEETGEFYLTTLTEMGINIDPAVVGEKLLPKKLREQHGVRKADIDRSATYLSLYFRVEQAFQQAIKRGGHFTEFVKFFSVGRKDVKFVLMGLGEDPVNPGPAGNVRYFPGENVDAEFAKSVKDSEDIKIGNQGGKNYIWEDSVGHRYLIKGEGGDLEGKDVFVFSEQEGFSINDTQALASLENIKTGKGTFADRAAVVKSFGRTGEGVLLFNNTDTLSVVVARVMSHLPHSVLRNPELPHTLGSLSTMLQKEGDATASSAGRLLGYMVNLVEGKPTLLNQYENSSVREILSGLYNVISDAEKVRSRTRHMFTIGEQGQNMIDAALARVDKLFLNIQKQIRDIDIRGKDVVIKDLKRKAAGLTAALKQAKKDAKTAIGTISKTHIEQIKLLREAIKTQRRTAVDALKKIAAANKEVTRETQLALKELNSQTEKNLSDLTKRAENNLNELKIIAEERQILAAQDAHLQVLEGVKSILDPTQFVEAIKPFKQIMDKLGIKPKDHVEWRKALQQQTRTLDKLEQDIKDERKLIKEESELAVQIDKMEQENIVRKAQIKASGQTDKKLIKLNEDIARSAKKIDAAKDRVNKAEFQAEKAKEELQVDRVKEASRQEVAGKLGKLLDPAKMPIRVGSGKRKIAPALLEKPETLEKVLNEIEYPDKGTNWKAIEAKLKMDPSGKTLTADQWDALDLLDQFGGDEGPTVACK